MKHILVDNVNEALSEGFWHLKIAGKVEDSRNGEVIVSPGPVLTEYKNPCDRVLFNPVRDANPTFHLMEALWMLAGEDRVKFLLPFNSNFVKYAEDDGHVHGAYGHRWRGGVLTAKDQITTVIARLQADPEDRRSVIQMWDAALDLDENKRDVPCNTTIYFDCRGGVLNMTVCNRSNDALWGAYGANAVHMSVLQEVIAFGVGVPVGVYRQFSNNFHAYLGNEVVDHFMENPPAVFNYYLTGAAMSMPILGPGETVYDLYRDCHQLVSLEPEDDFFSPLTSFFDQVAIPLRAMYLARKMDGERFTRKEIERTCPGNDWLVAHADWCERRDVK